MQNVSQYAATLLKSTLVFANECACISEGAHAQMQRSMDAHTLGEGPNKYMVKKKEIQQKHEKAMRNWAILTALIHQQTTTQRNVECVPLFFTLTELESSNHELLHQQCFRPRFSQFCCEIK